jgi:hypothetical protein
MAMQKAALGHETDMSDAPLALSITEVVQETPFHVI